MSIREVRKRASGESLKRRRPHRLSLIAKPARRFQVAEKSSPYTVAIRSRRIQIAIDFMNANLNRRIRLGDLAAAANLSPSHFSYLFKDQTGLSPGEFLRRLRMEKARELLASSLLSIKEIMGIVGYNNKTHFSRHFRRSFGVVPSDYRKGIPTQ